MTAHIHIDPLGGVSGDMFVSAMGDAFPALRAEALQMIERSGFPVQIKFHAHTDHLFTGFQFDVKGKPVGEGSYIELDGLIKKSAADELVKTLASKMLECLADAESKVHAVPRAQVHFHEIGGWDTVIDILLAAFFIVKSGAASWSVGPLPFGGGTVDSAHGRLPIPAPATMELLKGFTFFDDGVAGERITPTGAAILRGLNLVSNSPAGSLTATGHGFGTRKLERVSNVLRVTVLAVGENDALISEMVGVLTFEIDDQTPEDLAAGLDRLRSRDGIIDVSTSVMFAKKGRLATHVQVLARLDAADAAAKACLEETTTLGVRLALVPRYVLPRTLTNTDVAGKGVRVKAALTPSGKQRLKAENDDCASAGDREAREALRRHAEMHHNKVRHEH